MAKSDEEVKDAILGYAIPHEILNAHTEGYDLRFREFIGRVSAHVGIDEDRIERLCRSVISMRKGRI